MQRLCLGPSADASTHALLEYAAPSARGGTLAAEVQDVGQYAIEWVGGATKGMEAEAGERSASSKHKQSSAKHSTANRPKELAKALALENTQQSVPTPSRATHAAGKRAGGGGSSAASCSITRSDFMLRWCVFVQVSIFGCVYGDCIAASTRVCGCVYWAHEYVCTRIYTYTSLYIVYTLTLVYTHTHA